MLKAIKKQINGLLDVLAEAEGAIRSMIMENDAAGLMNVLADAQDAAVAIGSRIEEAEGLGAESGGMEGEEAIPTRAESGLAGAAPAGDMSPAARLVGMLERYCEFLWKMSQEQGAEVRIALLGEAWKLLDNVKQGIAKLPEQKVAVFMPYKASMWDCMESVWQAACDDPDCVPYVMPIPYFDLKDERIIASHYEGDKFPDYVPIVSYINFSLEEMQPDMIFIHNPFDKYNSVTRVLPQFFSSELRKVTKRLTYIPYYVTGDSVFVTHRYLPTYENMDFIVTQTEKMIDSYSTTLPREKFLPFGSPIADRILRLEREKPAIPEEWKEQLWNGRDFGGDRAVMLNTSISLLMKQKERFLDKIEYLFELAKNMEGITLVWRPHPLLHTSAQSMGEKYAARLAALEEKFLKEKIGVLDKTPDIGITVALCDAYLGETASSVLHMFGIAGKPRFYINLQIPKKQEGGSEDKFFVGAYCQTDDKEYYVLDEPGWIAERDKKTGKKSLLARIPGREVVRGRAYRAMEIKDGSLWVYPENARGTLIYHIESGRMRKIFCPQESVPGSACKEENTGKSFGEGICRDAMPKEAAAGKTVGEGMPGDAIPESDAADYITVGEECVAIMRAERFKRGNLSHEWHENEKNCVEDFFRFLQSAKDNELAGYQGAYAVWLASLDGSCGRKVLQAVKDSLKT